MCRKSTFTKRFLSARLKNVRWTWNSVGPLRSARKVKETNIFLCSSKSSHLFDIPVTEVLKRKHCSIDQELSHHLDVLKVSFFVDKLLYVEYALGSTIVIIVSYQRSWCPKWVRGFCKLVTLKEEKDVGRWWYTSQHLTWFFWIRACKICLCVSLFAHIEHGSFGTAT